MKRRFGWIILAVLLFFIEAGYFLVTPPFQAPDEQAHFLRIYQLSEGRLRGRIEGGKTGDDVPRIVFLQAFMFSDLPFWPEKKAERTKLLNAFLSSPKLEGDSLRDRVFADFPSTEINSPMSYIPQVLGCLLGRALHVRVLQLYYVERLFSVISTFLVLSCMFFLILRYEVSRFGFFLGLMTPMAIFLVNSLSADTVNLLLSMSFGIATAIASKVDRRSWFGISLFIMTLLTTSKFIYFPLVVLILPALWRSDALPRFEKCVTGVLFFIVPLGFAGAWLSYVYPRYISSMPGVNPTLSLYCLRTHFFQLAPDLISFVMKKMPFYFHSFIGVLGWLDTSLSLLCYVLFTLVSLFVIFSRPNGTEENTPTWIAVLAFFGPIALTSLSVYLTWNLPGSHELGGIQGRYFLPVVVALAFSPFRIGLSPKAYRYGSITVLTLILVVHVGALSALYHRYWIVS
jgi:uncharacterized membrane protein